MKHFQILAGNRARSTLLLAWVLPVIATFANTITAGGVVPAISNLTVTSIPAGEGMRSGGLVAIAEVEIDNNLPSFELALSFPESAALLDGISEVRLEPLGGVLGIGLTAPDAYSLQAGASPGNFVWRPGLQRSATQGLRLRILAVCGRPEAPPATVRIGMSGAY